MPIFSSSQHSILPRRHIFWLESIEGGILPGQCQKFSIFLTNFQNR